ncbi:MBL fold metallo-hydrolase [Teredinibacter purpureus]|uniref:MBL fold metallo-hydrolase n=1 Tax=Teredinibacter purpureus TaxID=2731756 RepID=UPI001F15FC61|nr:MBL fold metallo-hydrolase [Teredinibacter purpureus]
MSSAWSADEITFSTSEITDNLYLIEGQGGFAGGNMVLSVGDDGVVLIDDSMPPLLDKLKAAIRDVSERPVDFLINTHMHGDHTGNNAAFGSGITHVVGHENVRERMKHAEIDTPEGKKPTPKAALPVITFSEEIHFHLNGDRARVVHLADAHTDGDAIIIFEKHNVIHAGDIFFNGLFPFIDLNNGGSAKGYLAAQQAIYAEANESTVIVPGHGPIAKRSDLKKSIKMLSQAISKVSALKDSGKSLDEVIVLNPLKTFHKDWDWGFISTEKMTRTLYQDL